MNCGNGGMDCGYRGTECGDRDMKNNKDKKNKIKKGRCLGIILLAAVLALTGCGKTAAGGSSSNNSAGVDYAIADGAAQPIIQFTNFRDDWYSNEKSDILRFCVYVETDNDTDGDGKDDLVKVFAQVPTAAVNGDYKAGVIYDPTPYNAGTNEIYSDEMLDNADGEFDYGTLYKSGEKRADAEEISTYELAVSQDRSEYVYDVPVSGAQGYDYADQYDYYLVRGFAVIECAGIGTYGSEGFELCGFDLEAISHKCVIEWLTGNRKAYSDKNGTNEVKADWSNGKVAMIGLSYGGTLPYEVATLGVEGLETIIPESGISCWYKYTNSLGISHYYEGNYIDTLAANNCGGCFTDESWSELKSGYASFLKQIRDDQDEANGNYTDVWKISDYTGAYEKINCSALIVQGLNDFNVTAEQADGMYQAFKKAGQTVKMVLHQNGHDYPDGLMIGDTLWQELLNKWLSHYLLGVDNGIENMAEVTYQSNVDGEFYTADSWRDFNYEDCSVNYEQDTNTVTSENLDEVFSDYVIEDGTMYIDQSTKSEFACSLSGEYAASYDLNLAGGTTIYGTPEVHFKASPTVSGYEGTMATAMLIDVIDGEKAFSGYMTMASLGDTLPMEATGSFELGGGLGYGDILSFEKSETKAKIISYGWLDLANPGGSADLADYEENQNVSAGETYDYTFYMVPTVYTLEEGHTLRLVLMTYDPSALSLVDDDEYVDYGYTIMNESLEVKIPVK